MGFYGNITNTSKTQFQFDRIYPNRKMMDENAGTDGIYMGRYVLVEYDINDEKYLDNYPRLFKYYNSYYYVADMQNNLDSRIEVKYGEKNVERGQFFRVTEKLDFDPSNGVDNSVYVLYKCTGLKENNIATFEPVSDADEIHNNYVRNYNTDTKEYGPGRGWDSTVWQKVFVGGDTKYVLIAELNSVVPTFGITVDAPTMNPIVPHFDQESNNIYYKLHLQPSWGMRVKEGEADKSDEEVIWKSVSYDSTTDKETVVEETKKGAIYYNKAGFSKDNIVYSPAGTEDRVTIEPTGVSKTKYNVHNGSAAPQTKEAPDIQEVSIILPSIGDSIAEMWDLVYGNSGQNDGSSKRNTDINWDSTDGLRMVNVTEDGNGWTYDPDKVETLAGGINAIHDLMGMIIADKDDLSKTNVDELNLDGIYYDKKTGTYNRKVKDYEYTVIENKNTKPYGEETEVTLTAETYKPNIYYLNQELTDKDTVGEFIPGETYYEKRLLVEPKGAKVEGLVNWTPGMYYYKNVLGNIYTLDKSESPDEDKIYYKVSGFTPDKDEVKLPATYEKDKYWYKKESELIKEYYDYYLDTNEKPTADTDYYAPIFTPIKNQLPYKKETYVKKEIDGNKTYWVFDKAEDIYDKDAEYYIAGEYEVGTVERTYVDESGITVTETIETLIPITPPVRVFLFDPAEKIYYYKPDNNTYKIFDSYNDSLENVTTFYTIDEGTVIKDFYVKGDYYYQKYPGVFVLDEEEAKIEGRKYYRVSSEETVPNFYRSNTYYYYRESDKAYVLDTSETMTEGIDYFLGEEFYVFEDTLGVFEKYSLWNNNVTTVPHTVTLARRKAKWDYRELVGFARSMNTIHGLILEINKIMEFEDKKTRELDTVQGCINRLQDIIFKFDQLVPGTFMIVDAYGRAHSADYTTKQSYSAINKNTGNTVSTIDETEDRWIDFDVNDNAKESTIYIKHNFTPVGNKTSTVDKNGNGDTIKTYFPIVDNMGHIVGDHIETTTLPYGYKIFEDSNESKGSSVASSTQDTFVFKGDSWVNPTVTNDLLTINHIGPVGTTPAAKDAVEPKFGDTFNIEDWYFDDKGHKYAGGTHTVRIPDLQIKQDFPQGLLIASRVMVNLEPAESDNPADRAYLAEFNRVGDLVLDGYQSSITNGVIKASDSINGAFEKLQTQIVDEITNRENAITQEISDRDTAISNAISTVKTEITGDATETIASLLQKINALQDSYDALLARVQALEAYHNEENV